MITNNVMPLLKLFFRPYVLGGSVTVGPFVEFDGTSSMYTSTLSSVSSVFCMEEVTDITGGLSTITIDSSNVLRLPDGNTQSGNLFIRVGKGNSPATKEDYTLENLIPIEQVGENDCLIPTSASKGLGSKSSIYITSFYNPTNHNITVKEVGLYYKSKNTISDSSAANYYNKCLLLYREVIDPVTIAPGQTKIFTIENSII